MQPVNSDDNPKVETDQAAQDAAAHSRSVGASVVTADVAPKIDTIGPKDILMGRGARQTDNPGNARLRQRVAECHPEYARTTRRRDKHQIAVRIVEEIRAQGGRFLRQIDTVPPSYVVVYDEKELSTKVKQLLRDMGPESMERRAERRLYRYRKLGVQQSTSTPAEPRKRSRSTDSVQKQGKVATSAAGNQDDGDANKRPNQTISQNASSDLPNIGTGTSPVQQEIVSSTFRARRRAPMNFSASVPTHGADTALQHSLSQYRLENLHANARMHFYPPLSRDLLAQLSTTNTAGLLSRPDSFPHRPLTQETSLFQNHIPAYPLQHATHSFPLSSATAANYLAGWRNAAALWHLPSSSMLPPLSTSISSHTANYAALNSHRMALLESILLSRAREQQHLTSQQTSQSSTVEPRNTEPSVSAASPPRLGRSAERQDRFSP